MAYLWYMVMLRYDILIFYDNSTISCSWKYMVNNTTKYRYIMLYGNFEILKVTIWCHVVIKKLPYELTDVSYDIDRRDLRLQCREFKNHHIMEGCYGQNFLFRFHCITYWLVIMWFFRMTRWAIAISGTRKIVF